MPDCIGLRTNFISYVWNKDLEEEYHGYEF